MADAPKILRLTCPVCETRLKIVPDLDRFACQKCGTELTVVRTANIVRLEPTPEAADEMSSSERELVEVQEELRQRGDSYGVGCAFSTLGVLLVACIGGLLATLLKNTLLLAIVIGAALVLLAVILFFFVGVSAQGTRALVRRRDSLAATITQERAEG